MTRFASIYSQQPVKNVPKGIKTLLAGPEIQGNPHIPKFFLNQYFGQMNQKFKILVLAINISNNHKICLQSRKS